MISSEYKFKIADLLQNNKKIEAIKMVREIYNIGLKEAAEEVQTIEDEFFPERKGMFSPSMKTMDVSKVVGGVFTGLGAIFLVVVSIIIWNDRQETGDSYSINGKVTDLDYSSNGTAAPVIKYRLNGEQKLIHGTVWSNPPSYDIGEDVELLVNKDGKVTINSFLDRYFVIGIFGFFAVIFGGIGILVMRFLK